jgi:fructose-specific component phosphotransferase system IIB-like protein
MTDRELLELAAKAAGVKWIDPCFNYDEFGRMMLDFGAGVTEWNPLTSDGDAFRLAVKLAICVNQGKGAVIAERNAAINSPECGVIEALSADPYAATRRAIVRAAAEIGKQMGDE